MSAACSRHNRYFSGCLFFTHCCAVFRHIGLFTADQNLKGDSPKYTRQNANGNRRGLEVPEERDYYPYWGPSPWKDIAIMVSNKETAKLMKEHVNSRDHSEKGKFWHIFIILEVYI